MHPTVLWLCIKYKLYRAIILHPYRWIPYNHGFIGYHIMDYLCNMVLHSASGSPPYRFYTYNIKTYYTLIHSISINSLYVLA